MAKIVHARLDDKTTNVLDELVNSLGWTESKIIREGIMRMAQHMTRMKPRKIIGLGKFRSGIKDLASNKAHLNGFGR